VIATRGVDTPEGFAEQFGVVLVPAQDVAALSTCLKDVLTSDELRQKMKANALKAAGAFSWPSIARATAGFYGSLSADRTTASND
jgi:glycosyltransferase involved in cell wall biosynthesis